MFRSLRYRLVDMWYFDKFALSCWAALVLATVGLGVAVATILGVGMWVQLSNTPESLKAKAEQTLSASDYATSATTAFDCLTSKDLEYYKLCNAGNRASNTVAFLAHDHFLVNGKPVAYGSVEDIRNAVLNNETLGQVPWTRLTPQDRDGTFNGDGWTVKFTITTNGSEKTMQSINIDKKENMK